MNEVAQAFLLKKVGNARWTEMALTGGLRPHGLTQEDLRGAVQSLLQNGSLVRDNGLLRRC